MYVSVVNMSKSCCFAFVLAVICLSVKADAQPTVDETMACSSSTLEEVMNMVKIIVSNQQQNAKEINDLKDEIRDVKRLLSSNTTDCKTQSSTQALVSALVCEYMFYFEYQMFINSDSCHCQVL